MFKKEYRMLLTGLCTVFITTVAIAQQKPVWQLQPGTIVTRWAKQVSPSKVLPEYPRPQLVRHQWTSLNGLWEYTITQKTVNAPSRYTGYILVPYPIESVLSGVRKQLKPEQLLWYHRRFTKPPTHLGDRVLLHFGAVDFEATIFVNDKQLAMHKGGYQHFTVDITDNLKTADNDLVVKVWDPTDAGLNPHGKQVLNPQGIMYTPSSGIWQTVWMEVVPQNYIQALKITPDIDKRTVSVAVDIGGGDASNTDDAGNGLNTSDSPSNYSINVQVKSGATVLSRFAAAANHPIIVSVNNPRLWSPDDPFLYDLKLQLVKNGKVVDEISSYFGMRKITIQKDEKGFERIFLNNKYIYNLGTLDQGFWPDGLYTAPTDAALKFDIEAAKAMGFNTIRKHIKIEPDRWYYHADKIGMLVWQDMVNPGNDTQEGHTQFEKENKENITQLYNHPAIITWVLFNEKWGQYDQERLTKWMKEYDPTRLVNGHSGEMLYVNDQLRSRSPNPWIGADMTDVHSYPYPRNAPHIPGKAMVLGEFGGIGVPVEGHLWNDLVTGWGYDGVVTPSMMQKQYTAMVDSLKTLERLGLSASIYTQPFDVESEQNGLMTYDRAIIKLPVTTLREIHAKVWPVTKNYLATTKGFSASIADKNNKPYAVRLEEYQGGRKDSTFIRRLALMALSSKDTTNANILAEEFIAHLKDTFQDSNLRFVQKFIFASQNPGFQIFLKNNDKIDQVLGQDEAEAIVTFIIEKEEILPFLSNQTQIDWLKIEKRTVEKYGTLGEETLLQRKVLHSVNHQDWKTFGSSFAKWYSEYGYKRKWISLASVNDMAWSVFQNTDDRTALEAAVKVTEKLLQRDQMAALLDTYANLLYKLGNKAQAIAWQEKAFAAEPGNGDIKANLEKMKRGERTWPNAN